MPERSVGQVFGAAGVGDEALGQKALQLDAVRVVEVQFCWPDGAVV